MGGYVLFLHICLCTSQTLTALLVTAWDWMFILANLTTQFFIVLINNHNQSHLRHCTTTSSPLPPHPSQNNDSNNTMELKSILSLQVLNISDEEPVFIKQWLHSWLSLWTWRRCPGWHSSAFPRRMLRYLEGLEQPAYFPGSTSSAVMEQRFQRLIGSRCEAKEDFPWMLSQWKTH